MSYRRVGQFCMQSNTNGVIVTYRQTQSIWFHAIGLPDKRDIREFENRALRAKRMDLNTLFGLASGKKITVCSTPRRIIL